MTATVNSESTEQISAFLTPATLDSDDVTPAPPLEIQIASPKLQLIKPLDSISLRRFKQFSQLTLAMKGNITLMAGPNNAGKSSLLHALAVWEFCRLATLMERGPDGLGPKRIGVQGFGIGDDEFSPINVPSLKHLWTNLNPQKKDKDEDGYTLHIECRWTTADAEKYLAFALSLANDRLFIKVLDSNLDPDDPVPNMAYLPPFAGISAREERLGGAIRRRRIGEGLAGAVLRNLLLDMHVENARKRTFLLDQSLLDNPDAKKRTIKRSDLTNLRNTDPWEILQQNLREVFGAELHVKEFNEEYHSYIQIQVAKGILDGWSLKKHEGYTKRDLMVEGSGFLQWLSIFVLALDPQVNVLMLDEPDAHLHPQLQLELVSRLKRLVEGTPKQVFIATHSSEILKHSGADKIMHFRQGHSPKYLTQEEQKVGMLAGIGADFAPRIHALHKGKRVFFCEGKSDRAILRTLGETLGTPIAESWVPWITSDHQRERRMLWKALGEEIPGITAISLRDRDEGEVKKVGPNLEDNDYVTVPGFRPVKWRRRHIESYLVVPRAIAAAAGKPVADIVTALRDDHGLHIGENYWHSETVSTYLELRGKELFARLQISAQAVAKQLEPSEICDDLKLLVAMLA
jgi:predicted ATPase